MTTTEERKERRAAMPTPEKLIQLGTAFWPSKVLLAAVHFDLFTHLASGPKSLKALESGLGLHPRAARDFLDTLVGLGVVLRQEDGAYANTPEAQLFLSRGSALYMGDMLRMANERLWDSWGRLEDALRTGKPQNETRQGGQLFDLLYGDPHKLRLFVNAMIGLSAGSSLGVIRRFDFSRCRTFCDIGGGPGTLNAAVARAFPSVQGIDFDLPPVRPLFEEYARLAQVTGRVKFIGGDCLADPLPPADVYGVGNLLHGVGEKASRALLRKVYQALPAGGSVLLIEAMIDDARRENVFGLLMSLDMLIETEEGRNFTVTEALGWLRSAGFEKIDFHRLRGPFSLAVGTK